MTDYAVLQLRDGCQPGMPDIGKINQEISKKSGNLHHDGTVLRHHEFVIQAFINYNILCHLLTFFNETGVQPEFGQDTCGL